MKTNSKENLLSLTGEERRRSSKYIYCLLKYFGLFVCEIFILLFEKSRFQTVRTKKCCGRINNDLHIILHC